MLDFIANLDDYGAWTVAVIGGLAAIGTALRWVYKRIRKVIKWGQDMAARLERVDRLATSAEYHSRPNGGGSAYDHLVEEIRSIGRRLEEHIAQGVDIHDEQAAAISHLAESLPIVARSVPHPADAHLPDAGPDPAP